MTSPQRKPSEEDTVTSNQFRGWAVVELFGHVKEIGFVTTEAFGTAVLFRIDTPDLPSRDFELTDPEYATIELDGHREQRWCPAGTKVRREGSPAKSRLVGPGAIYSITPCGQATALRALEEFTSRPLIALEIPLPAQKALPDPGAWEEDAGEDVSDL